MNIIGAGMSGCLAGIMYPEATIYEASDIPPINHNAVLRFRSNIISQATGIPFKKVKVRKGIFSEGKFVKPNILLCNKYSYKVLNLYTDRSIWNIDTVERFIAPIDFQQQLFNLVKDRVILDHPIDSYDLLMDLLGNKTISTIPLPKLAEILEIDLPFETQYKKIVTAKFEVKDCNTYQTIYYPDWNKNVYRATITGNELIIESTEEIEVTDINYVLDTFGIFANYEKKTTVKKYNSLGKIADVDDMQRKQLLYHITNKFNIYSAGRYAIWKNILMDDVLKDLRVIKEMIAANDYDRMRMSK